jgi:hypothetical protein
LDNVLAYVADRPPKSWTDSDLDRFSEKSQTLGELFRQARLEAPAAALPPDESAKVQQLARDLRAHTPMGVSPRLLRAALLALLAELDHADKNGEGR